MPRWKPRDLAGALLIGASLGTGVFGQDQLAAVEPVGRAAVTPLEQLQQETAQERWARVKARYQPVVTDIAKPGALATGNVQPIPDDASDAAAAAQARTAPPLPDSVEEPAWVVTAAPVETLTQPLQDDVPAPARAIPARVMRQPVATADSSENADLTPADLDLMEFIEDENIEEAAGRREVVESMTAAVRGGLRKIGDIQPFYDVQVDKDIREYADARASDYGVKFGTEEFQPRMFADTAMVWEPTNFYHYPLYFEDATLERYGHTYPFVVQPFVSVAKFGGQLLALPYQMTLDPIDKPMYALGWYRPGEVAPKLKYQIPWNAQAAAVEAGVVTGLIFLIP